jgi:hypothetical protein
MSRRWVRLDVGWDDSEWLAELSPAAQLAWVKLLCHTKRDGVRGVSKALAPAVAARRWGVPAGAVREMVEAARRDGAIQEDNGSWSICGWDQYQSDPKARERLQRFRGKGEK